MEASSGRTSPPRITGSEAHHRPRPTTRRERQHERATLAAADTTENTLTDQPWWTPADQAELELLVYELVEAAYSHAAREPDCCHGDLVRCERYASVIGTVLEWRDHRIAYSRAAWLRAVQTSRETPTLHLVETA